MQERIHQANPTLRTAIHAARLRPIARLHTKSGHCTLPCGAGRVLPASAAPIGAVTDGNKRTHVGYTRATRGAAEECGGGHDITSAPSNKAKVGVTDDDVSLPALDLILAKAPREPATGHTSLCRVWVRRKDEGTTFCLTSAPFYPTRSGPSSVAEIHIYQMLVFHVCGRGAQSPSDYQSLSLVTLSAHPRRQSPRMLGVHAPSISMHMIVVCAYARARVSEGTGGESAYACVCLSMCVCVRINCQTSANQNTRTQTRVSMHTLCTRTCACNNTRHYPHITHIPCSRCSPTSWSTSSSSS